MAISMFWMAYSNFCEIKNIMISPNLPYSLDLARQMLTLLSKSQQPWKANTLNLFNTSKQHTAQRKTWKKISRTALESCKKIGTRMFRTRGNILRRTNGNMFFTIIFKFKHSPYIFHIFLSFTHWYVSMLILYFKYRFFILNILNIDSLFQIF